jgi:hypothetical protein
MNFAMQNDFLFDRKSLISLDNQAQQRTLAGQRWLCRMVRNHDT